MIGILGGMGTQSGLDFSTKLAKLYRGKLDQKYDEKLTANYMKGENIEINIEIFTGKKKFTAYTMDLSKEYVKINADYRS